MTTQRGMAKITRADGSVEFHTVDVDVGGLEVVLRDDETLALSEGDSIELELPTVRLKA